MSHVVAIDARTLGATGLGSYVSQLLEGCAAMDHEFRFRVLCARPESVAGFPPGKVDIVRATAPTYSPREHWQIARLASGSDLLHCPHYNVPYLYNGRLVVTIHDLTHLMGRDFVPSRPAYWYARFMLRTAAHRAQRIITVSEFSKRSICDYLGVQENKVCVIHNALSERFEHARKAISSPPKQNGINRPYILYVGLLKPHKNVEGLIRAYSALPASLRDSQQLVLAGKLDRSYPALRQLTEDLRLQDKVLFVGHVIDDELHALYAGARVFVLPSFNEGFGLPALEAMAYGIPVVASNTSSLPEVVGDAGILVNPRDTQEISSAISTLLVNESLRNQFAELGRRRVQLFSAKEFAMRHLEVYREAIRG